ncbi:MAG: prepilin-type N-terminal cleavage/methylation domain-containing protein [Elusimicrobia bacterium]|nr:prepilin-type N-terminal cleavage/methylation domain-containing protein [Elusimicrobiota bacterium]
MTRFRQIKGFTLIELMLVVAIIGLLSAIAIPKFAGLIIKSKEAAAKAKLASLRSALSIYYCDNEGILPNDHDDIEPTLVPKYIDEIPSINIPPSIHPYKNGCRNSVADISPKDAWVYLWGSTHEIFVNCSHLDSTGRVWSTW